MCSVPDSGRNERPIVGKICPCPAGTIIPSVLLRASVVCDRWRPEARSAAATVAALRLPEIAEMGVRTSRTSASVFVDKNVSLDGMEETTPPNQECKHVQSPQKDLS